MWEYGLNVTGNATDANGAVVYNKYKWRLLTQEAAFGGRAWFGLAAWTGNIPQEDVTVQARKKKLPPRVWMVGGGNLGTEGPEAGSREVSQVEGRADAFWTRDGKNWTRANWQFGGPGLQRPLWSSSDWACFRAGSNAHVFRGVWGHSLVTFNTTTRISALGDLFLVGGASDAVLGSEGSVLNRVWRANFHFLCFLNGQECGGLGSCQANQGCVGCGGDDYCQGAELSAQSAAVPPYAVSLLCWGVTLLLTARLSL